MNYAKLELDLREIVERRLREGWEVGPVGCEPRVQDGRCCLLGAVWIESGDGIMRSPGALDIAPLLALSYDQARVIENGFEGWARGLRIPLLPAEAGELYAIGARIRRDYCETSE